MMQLEQQKSILPPKTTIQYQLSFSFWVTNTQEPYDIYNVLLFRKLLCFQIIALFGINFI